jgi:hypothetical protein
VPVLYRCETCSLTVREEHGLGVFENRVLGRIFGLKREEVAGGWRRLYDEELHNFQVKVLNIIQVIKSRRMNWVVHVTHMEEMRNMYNILVGKPEGK